MLRISLRIIVITSILIVFSAFAISTNLVSPSVRGLSAAAIDAGKSEGGTSAVDPRTMTTPLNAITSFDASLIRRWTLGLDPFTANQLTVADVSGTNGVEPFDAQLVSDYVGNGEGLISNTGTAVPPGLLIGDVSGSGPHYDGSPGTPAVSLPTMNGGGGIFVVPITVDDLTGLGVVSYDFQITFDPTVVRPAFVSSAGTLSIGMTFVVRTIDPGHWVVSIYGANPLTGSGTLVNLWFYVTGTAGQSTELRFENYTDPSGRVHQGFLFNEGTPSVAAANGMITLIPFTPSPTSTRTSTPTASPTPTIVPVSLSNVTAPTGTEITVPITTGDLTGLRVGAYDLQITFDPAVVQPVMPPVIVAGTLSSAMIAVSNLNFPGHLILSVCCPPNYMTGSGTLINLKFAVVGTMGQSTALTFENFVNPNTTQIHVGFNYNEGNPGSTLTNGSVTVGEGPSVTGTVTYGNAIGSPTTRSVSNVQVNGAGSLPVSALTTQNGIYSLGGFGAGIYSIIPSKTGDINGSITSFDAARIAQNVVGINTLNPMQQFVGDVSSSGGLSSLDSAMIATFAAGQPYSAPGVGSTGNWKFIPAARTHASIESSITGENFTAILMGDVTGNWTPTTARAANYGGGANRGPERDIGVTAPSLVMKSDSGLLIPVAIQGAPKKEIISYEFDLRYEPSVIRPQAIAVDLAGTVSRGLSVVTNEIEPGLLRVVVYGPMPINEDGVLLNLRFTAVGTAGAVSPLTWERIMFNEGEPRVSTTAGRVELF